MRLALVILAGVAGTAWAQVQQVPQNNPLDANPMVGSYGSNRPVPGYVPINGNDIVNGNVGGLKYFHGNIPYRAPYTFGGRLPSSDISNFARQSAGAPLGQPYTGETRPYYLPSATVSGASGSVVPAPYGSGFDNRWAPGTTISPLARIGEPITTLGEAVPIGAAVPWRRYALVGASMEEISPLQPSGLFGMRYSPLTAPSTTQPKKKNHLDDDEPALRTDIGVTEQRGESKPIQPLRPRVRGDVQSKPEDQLVGRTNLPAEEPSEVYQNLLGQLKKKAPAGNAETATTTQPARLGRVEIDPLTGRPRAAEPERAPGLQFQSTDPTKPFYRTPRRRDLAEEPTERLRSGRDVKPIPSFRGTKGTAFDEQMKLAENQLQQGRYLDAASTYQDAIVLAPQNPLPVVGRAHAQLAAGMYADAATDLKLLFRKSPELTAVHYDLAKFLPAKRLEYLQDDLTKLAHGTTFNAGASFLLTYLQYQLGRPAEVRKELDYWHEQAPRDPWPNILTRAWVGEEKDK